MALKLYANFPLLALCTLYKDSKAGLVGVAMTLRVVVVRPDFAGVGVADDARELESFDNYRNDRHPRKSKRVKQSKAAFQCRFGQVWPL